MKKTISIAILLISFVASMNASLLITRQRAGVEVLKGGDLEILLDFFDISGITDSASLEMQAMEGEHYTAEGSIIHISADYSGLLEVSVKAKEGTDLSPAFPFMVLVVGGETRLTSPNSGFEKGDLSQWSSRNGIISTIVSRDTAEADVVEGQYSLRVIKPATGYLRTSGTTYFPVVEGRKYRMVFSARGDTAGMQLGAAMNSGSNDPVHGHTEYFTLSDAWQEYSYELVSPITSSFGCKFEFLTLNKFYWIDNIYLLETGDPSPPVYYSDIFVSSLSGDDANSGAEGSPLKTISKALEMVQPGSRILLREGRYHESNIIDQSGKEAAPLTLMSYPRETAVLDGSVQLTGTWFPHEGSIWKMKIEGGEPLSQGIQQLWMEGRMMKMARWPNHKGTFADDFNFDYTARDPEPGTNWDIETAFVVLDKPYSTVDPDSDMAYWKSAGVNLQSLTGTGKSFAGAMVGLKMGYETVLEEIISHEAGSDEFVSSSTEGNNRNQLLTLGNKQFFFILAHMACLDDEGEWYYDPGTNWLYVIPFEGGDPNTMETRAKTQKLALTISGASNVTLSGLTFFGTHFTVTNSQNLKVENCIYNYPSYFPAMLREKTVTFSPSQIHSTSATIFNCEFRYFDGTALIFSATETFSPVLVNNLFHNGRYDHMVRFRDCAGAYAARNTMYVSERGNGFKYYKSPQGLLVAELNYMHNLATHRSDASCIQVQSGSQNYDTLRYNWFHDTENKGIRFDGEPAGSLGTMNYNVGWSMWQGLQVKGDYHNIINNTFFNCAKRCDITVLADDRFGGNKNTIVHNNAAERMSGHRVRSILEHPLECTNSNNWNGFITDLDIATQLRDPLNRDFRPREKSDLVDAGIEVSPFTGDYIGDTPDIGAYEYGDTVYWIPGRKEAGASMPVPPSGSTTVMGSADLMWLGGLNAHSYRVYLGESPTTLEFMKEQKGNIFDPGDLAPDQVYFWRIDAVSDTGIVTGDTWHFVANGSEPGEKTLPVTYFENFDKGEDDANFDPWDENIWDHTLMKEDSTYVVDDMLRIWPLAGRTAWENKFRLTDINMILRPHPFMEFDYVKPDGTSELIFAVNVVSGEMEGNAVIFSTGVAESDTGHVYLNIAGVFEEWDRANPGVEWGHLEQFDIWFFPEKTDFTGDEEIIIDNFKLGFDCLSSRYDQILVLGQKHFAGTIGVPFFLGVDDLEIGILASDQPEPNVYPVVDPYELSGTPRIAISEGNGYTLKDKVITPSGSAGDTLKIPLVFSSGNLAAPEYVFTVGIGFVTETESLQDEKIKLYPNPFSDQLFIEGYEGIETIRMLDIRGRTYLLQRNPGSSLDVSDLPSGLYFVRIRKMSGEVENFKIIKQ